MEGSIMVGPKGRPL